MNGLPRTLGEAFKAAPFRSVLFKGTPGTRLADCPPPAAAVFVHQPAPLPPAGLAAVLADVEAGLAEGGSVLLLALHREARDAVKAEWMRREALAAMPPGGTA